MTELKKRALSNGFTLVELLVVISIIALLLSIMIPAMEKVRTQAKLVMCQANSKQIGTLISVYQADNSGYVPVVLNEWATKYHNSAIRSDNAYLSAAFIDYTSVKLPDNLEQMDWFQSIGGNSGNDYKEYVNKYLPEYFMCPLIRKKSVVDDEWQFDGVKIGRFTYTNITRRWKSDSYVTWLWQIPKGYDNRYSLKPSKYSYSSDGIAKYATMVWHGGYEKGVDPLYRFSEVKDSPTRWESQDNGSSPAESTVVYCNQGQFDNHTFTLYNYGSHPKHNRGGTNAIFADLHVGWVDGMNIGWP